MSTFEPVGADALHVYVKPFETCSMRLAPGVGLSNCCSSSVSIWAPVSVIVTMLFPNGCTAKASP